MMTQETRSARIAEALAAYDAALTGLGVTLAAAEDVYVSGTAAARAAHRAALMSLARAWGSTIVAHPLSSERSTRDNANRTHSQAVASARSAFNGAMGGLLSARNDAQSTYNAGARVAARTFSRSCRLGR